MKRIFKYCFTVALALIMLILPAGCGAKATERTDKQVTVTAAAVDANLRAFLGVDAANPDGKGGSRFYGSPSEQAAATWLNDRFGNTTLYPNFAVTKTDFTYTVQQQEIHSSNVVVRYNSRAANRSSVKQIIIGAHFDGGYGTLKDESGVSKSLGAMDNATGVATLMSLIDYCNTTQIDPGFDIVFVFFGGSYSSAGAGNYIQKTMQGTELVNTVLMINLQRFGGSNLYLYSDEVETQAHTYFKDKSAQLGSALNDIPKNIPIIQESYIRRLPYTHFAMLGDHAAFMQEYVPVANLFSGDMGTFNLSDIEKWGSSNMSGTANDTYTNLKAYRPNYASQMADAATLVVESLRDDTFMSVLTASRDNVYNYDWAVQSVWAYVGVIGGIVLIAVLLILLVKHFEKKYPYVPPKKKLKIAVFGMDYETKSAEDIYVDIKKPRNPFDGY